MNTRNRTLLTLSFALLLSACQASQTSQEVTIHNPASNNNTPNQINNNTTVIQQSDNKQQTQNNQTVKQPTTVVNNPSATPLATAIPSTPTSIPSANTSSTPTPSLTPTPQVTVTPVNPEAETSPSPSASPSPSPSASPSPSPSPSPSASPSPSPTQTPEVTPVPLSELDMNFVNIPAGSFQMGQVGIAEPVHEVTLSAFQMQTTEVTQKQWYTLMGEWPGGKAPGSNCRAGDNYPVCYTNWNDTQEFIQRMNQRGDGFYRLPTEAEWEYAVRAGSTTIFSCGDNEGCINDLAWTSNNAENKTHPVAKRQPNAWGLYDMQGNVMEWVQDWYGPYNDTPSINPTGPSTGEIRVLRGGSWNFNTTLTRSAHRYHSMSKTARANLVGFRLVRVL